MQKPKREITISNRYLYYYASLLKRIYGLIIRNEHKNQPDERYIGHLDEDGIPSSQEEGRLPGTPVQDEIVLFRFRNACSWAHARLFCPAKFPKSQSYQKMADASAFTTPTSSISPALHQPMYHLKLMQWPSTL